MLCMPSEICFCPTEHRSLPWKSPVPDISTEKESDEKLDFDCIWFWTVSERKASFQRIRDLIFFHLLIGAMYLAKEEMTYQGKKIRVAAKILKQYSRNPFVEQKLTLKECIRYTRQIKSLFWKLLAFTLVLFIQMHMYFVVAAVFVWMSSLGIDSL